MQTQTRENPPTNFGIVKQLTYGIYFAGQNIIWFLIGTFMALFFTDIKIPADDVAVILLVVKIWGAVIDPIFGAIIDKAKFKSGKFLPWIRMSVFLVPITTILIFAIPSTISLKGKIIWALLSNIIWDTAYTVCDAPAYGLITVLSKDVSVRNKLVAISRIFGNIASAAATGFLPALREAIGSWFASAVYFSIIAIVLMLPIAIFGREIKIKNNTVKKKVSIKQIIYYIFHNKYMLIFYLGTLIMQGFAIFAPLYAYFARYCLGDEKLLGYMMSIKIVPIILLGVFIPFVLKRIDKYYLFMWSIFGMFLSFIVQYFIGYKNWTAFLIVFSFQAVIFAINNLLIYAFTPDFAEYGTWKTKINAEGITFTLQTFISKVNGAISAAIAMFLLAHINFIEGENAAQLPGFNDKLWFIFTIIPAIGSLIVLPIFYQYKLREKDIRMYISENSKQ